MGNIDDFEKIKTCYNPNAVASREPPGALQGSFRGPLGVIWVSSGDHLGSSDDSSPRSFAQSPERILLEPQKSKISIVFRTFYESENRDLNAEKPSVSRGGG